MQQQPFGSIDQSFSALLFPTQPCIMASFQRALSPTFMRKYQLSVFPPGLGLSLSTERLSTIGPQRWSGSISLLDATLQASFAQQLSQSLHFSSMIISSVLPDTSEVENSLSYTTDAHCITTRLVNTHTFSADYMKEFQLPIETRPIIAAFGGSVTAHNPNFISLNNKTGTSPFSDPQTSRVNATVGGRINVITESGGYSFVSTVSSNQTLYGSAIHSTFRETFFVSLGASLRYSLLEKLPQAILGVCYANPFFQSAARVVVDKQSPLSFGGYLQLFLFGIPLALTSQYTVGQGMGFGVSVELTENRYSGPPPPQ